MADAHPNRGGQSIYTDANQAGRNRTDGPIPESQYCRCSRCGQIFNKVKFPKGWGEGNVQPSSQLNAHVSEGATTITVDSTAGFPSSGYIYIYETR